MARLISPDTHPINQRSYFFDQGICFECRQCGNCCVGEPGVVKVSEEEISTIARFLETPVSQFTQSFLTPYNSGYSIREDKDGRCKFYEKGCRIYPVRPMQCKTFPFWMSVFRSEAKFNQTKKECPGIGRGKCYTKEEIIDLILAF